MKKPPAQVVDELLSTIPPKQSKSMIAANPELAEAINSFLALKAAGDPRAHVSLAWFYNNKLRDVFGGPTFDSVRKYVREVLALDITTGKAIQ